MQAGHVADSPTAIMYTGPLPWNPAAVDSNRDDYPDANIADCMDLAESAFLDPLSPQAFAPPVWPYTLLAPMACSLEGTPTMGRAIVTSPQTTHRSVSRDRSNPAIEYSATRISSYVT